MLVGSRLDFVNCTSSSGCTRNSNYDAVFRYPFCCGFCNGFLSYIAIYFGNFIKANILCSNPRDCSVGIVFRISFGRSRTRTTFLYNTAKFKQWYIRIAEGQQLIPIELILFLSCCKFRCKFRCKLCEIVQNTDNFTLHIKRRYRDCHII